MSIQRDAWGERLPRHLGLGSAIAVLVGSTIGSGIFRVPAGVADRLHDPGPILIAWVVGGLVALFGAISTIFAEYLGYFVHFTPAQVRYTAAAAILFVGALNYVGVNSASIVMN